MSNQKGFTLIELLIVLAIIAILAAILIVIINPAQIMSRGRDTQRQGDLRNLSAAVDILIAEMSISNLTINWPSRGSCTSSSATGNIYFSINTTTSPDGWPAVVADTATGTTSTDINGNGWVPLDFSQIPSLNLGQLPVDPLNGKRIGNVVYAYSFTCNTDMNYEFAAKLERNNTLMANDGGNQPALYEVGPGRASLY
jgi:prepilin-type N-terminal cleavage/methylation domain-containing protein